MTSPLWIVNSGLLLIGSIAVGLVILTVPTVPPLKTIRPGAVSLPHRESSRIDLSRIYKNDPFKTIIIPEKPIEVVETKPQLPPPPQDIPPEVVQPEKIVFLPTLNVILKGIIFSSNEDENRIVLADEKSGKEDLYKIGDSVEDAEVIYIGADKATLIRSNGQQETLFLSHDDAVTDTIIGHPIAWSEIIEKTDDYHYKVDPELFVERIEDLAGILEDLDLTAAFNNGVSLGVQVGKITSTGVGAALGLLPDDIITSINDIPTASTDQRKAIYEMIKKLWSGDSIRLHLVRGSREIDMAYHIELPQSEPQEQENVSKNAMPTTVEVREQKQKEARAFLENEHELESVIDTIKAHDKRAMLAFGDQEAVLKRSKRI